MCLFPVNLFTRLTYSSCADVLVVAVLLVSATSADSQSNANHFEIRERITFICPLVGGRSANLRTNCVIGNRACRETLSLDIPAQSQAIWCCACGREDYDIAAVSFIH